MQNLIDWKYYIRITSCLFGLFLGVILSSAAATAQAEDADSGAALVVEKLHASLLDIMQNADQLGFSGRYKIMSPIVESSFDTRLIAQVVLSRYWKELKPEQQGQFVTLFSRLSASTYASRFDSYTDESFKTLSVEKMKNERLLVKTELVREKEEPVRLDYLIQQNAGNWLIINVIADGVSDLALKQAEYASIINTRGFDSLVSDIETKIRDLEAPQQTD